MSEISPLDGRYADRVGHLGRFFSEQALAGARVRVEVDWLLALDGVGLWPSLNEDERERAARLRDGFGDADFARIKEIERATRHDVKAVERFVRERLALRDANRVHFGLTSEDVNNLAYDLLLHDFLNREFLPQLRRLVARLCDLADAWADKPFPTRTHGQRATPSTAGKELAVFVSRLARQGAALRDLRLSGKVSGATGTYGALMAAFPDRDWVALCAEFVTALGFEPSPVTTQIEDHDRWAELFGIVRRIANIVIDLDRDVWMYLSYGLLREPPKPGEVGSSTMPHKINPIRFENSEGNLELAVALLGMLGDKLARSRMQRDLSDSTVERNMGVALAHVWLALDETRRGLEGVELNEARCLEELRASPELLAEPIQTLLRAAGGSDDPYELLKERTRGRAVTREDLVALVESLPVAESVKERVRAMRVEDYVGAAPRLARSVVADARRGFLAGGAP